MKKVIHREYERGKGDYGWLQTGYSFSFANWYNQNRMGFGALRVLNDDVLAPASGFPMHSHHNMEIVTIVMTGTLTHKDSLGNIGTVSAGEIQVMSAGTGITHSEYNASSSEPLCLFQIWIEPKILDSNPTYTQKSFKKTVNENECIVLISPTKEGGSISINQNAYLSEITLNTEHPITYTLHEKKNGVYVFVIEGTIITEKETLQSRDALGVWNTEKMTLSASSKASALLIEVPFLK